MPLATHSCPTPATTAAATTSPRWTRVSPVLARLSLAVCAVGFLLIVSGLTGGFPDEYYGFMMDPLISAGVPRAAIAGFRTVFLHRTWLGLGLLTIGFLGDLLGGHRYLPGLLSDRQTAVRFLAITAQLYIVLRIVRALHLEHNAFFDWLLPWTFYGFLFHYALTTSLRLPFFLLLSLFAIVGILGWNDGLCIISVGLLLIGCCHAPISYRGRVALLAGLATLLVVARVQQWTTPWSEAAWPLLFSMFLFRTIIFALDMKHAKTRQGPVRVLSYFFLLPNVAFPIFPPIDYGTVWRTYYDDEQHRIYQTGLKWMAYGVIHLLAYRYVNYYWVLSRDQVVSSGTLMQHLVTNYLVIARITGQYHLCVGMLHLFGFHLPRCMDNFLLATGFNDYWRRVNVYWKEFIQKAFYFPAYFRLKQLGPAARLSVATCYAFFMTWFLHSCQWFGLRGSFALSVPDITFWSLLGVLVLANSLLESRYGRKRTLGTSQFSPADIPLRALQATLVFFTVALLWSLWTSPSIAEWLAMLRRAQPTIAGIAPVFFGVLALQGAGMAVTNGWQSLDASRRTNFWLTATPTLACLLPLAAALHPWTQSQLPSNARDLLADLQTNRLNATDEDAQLKGYYEDLNDVNNFNLQLHKIYTKTPKRWSFNNAGLLRPREDFLRNELIPNLDVTFKGLPFRTNRWGMRDDECEMQRPIDTTRIALLGGSVTLGSGVAREDTFEALLERHLNEAIADRTHSRYEVLNFASSGHGTLRRIYALDQKAVAFQPQVVLFVTHGRDIIFDTMDLQRLPKDGIPYADIEAIVERADILDAMPESEAVARLKPYWKDLLVASFTHLKDTCQSHHVHPVLVLLPSTPGKKEDREIARIQEAAAQAGLPTVINLTDVYADHDPSTILVEAWDYHPNATGHRLIAERLYEALRSRPEVPLHLPGPPEKTSMDTSSPAK